MFFLRQVRIIIALVYLQRNFIDIIGTRLDITIVNETAFRFFCEK